jgi:hypothetical protein
MKWLHPRTRLWDWRMSHGTAIRCVLPFWMDECTGPQHELLGAMRRQEFHEVARKGESVGSVLAVCDVPEAGPLTFLNSSLDTVGMVA